MGLETQRGGETGLKGKKWLMVCGMSFVASVYAGAVICQETYPQFVNRRNMNQLIDRCTIPAESSYSGRIIDWYNLKNTNPDIIAWIEIPDTKIDYPILQHNTDNTFYLTHSFSQEENICGSIFTYHEFKSDFSDIHSIIFGHNMTSGEMFGNLSDYSEFEFAKTHKRLYLYLPGEIQEYMIYSAFSCSVSDFVYQYELIPKTKEYQEWLNKTVMYSDWKALVDPKWSDSVITLSTCTDERDPNRRFVVHAVLMNKKNTSL